jgi:hypothetical protein
MKVLLVSLAFLAVFQAAHADMRERGSRRGSTGDMLNMPAGRCTPDRWWCMPAPTGTREHGSNRGVSGTMWYSHTLRATCYTRECAPYTAPGMQHLDSGSAGRIGLSSATAHGHR